MNRADLIKSLKALEQCKVDRVELLQTKSLNTDLLERVKSKDNIIQSMEGKLQLQDQRLSLFEKQGSNYEGQIQLLKNDITALSKSLKKQKRKTAAIGIAGILITGSLTYFLITK